MPIDAIVFGARVASPWLSARTLRALERAGVEAHVAELDALTSIDGPVWLVRAGAVPVSTPRVPPRSATGRPLLAFGATIADAPWAALLATTGGDLSRAAFPRIDSVALDRPDVLAAHLSSGATLEEACAALVASGGVRAVRVPALDVDASTKLRVLEAITTLHRGGAERVVLDLVRALDPNDHDVVLAVLDRASRTAFEAPPATIQIHEIARSRAARIDALCDLAIARGVDVVHLHLVDGAEVRLAARAGIPVVVTVHNARQGWPLGLEAIGATDAALVIACSRGVDDELHEAGLASPIRTIWNGIPPIPRSARRKEMRAEIGVPADATLLLAVANHRPQKRLERMPVLVAEMHSRGRAAHLAIVGEPVRADAISLAVAANVAAESKRLGVTDSIHVVGMHEDVSSLYAAADVVVGTSAFEGLSLVHLEAIAAGRPLVVTDVEGTREIAAKHAGVLRVPIEASPATFVDAIETALASASDRGLAPDFEAKRMGERHAALFRRVVAHPERHGGIVLVTNNFAVGGAQASARRLLTALHAEGIAVRAIVIEEQREYPTPGRALLERAGVAVHVTPRAGAVDPAITAADAIAEIDRAAPDAVLFWNVIPEHKVLIADMLVGVPVWDVSPGEMYYASFAKYFARPRVALPYLALRDYGRLLTGAIVKYAGERARAEKEIGAPVFVVPNGVPVPENILRRAAGDKVVVGTLARISPDKKLDELVAAMKHVPFAELRIAGPVERGSEAYAEELRARAADLSITFVGEKDSAEFLADIDLFAMVSEPSGCPNASLEAMAAGLAIVATDAGGASEQIVHGETGLLTARADPVGLGRAIDALVTDRARREAMGDAAHARAFSHFNLERMVADYVRVCLRSAP